MLLSKQMDILCKLDKIETKKEFLKLFPPKKIEIPEHRRLTEEEAMKVLNEACKPSVADGLKQIGKNCEWTREEIDKWIKVYGTN